MRWVDREISGDKERAEEFNKFFSSVYTKEDSQNTPSKMTEEGTNVLDSISISEADVLMFLMRLQQKSPGPDGIHPRVLKECAAVLAKPLTSSLEEGQLPRAWKEANVSPIHKKGTKSSVDNYRPVNLTSVCCKVMEKVVRRALLQNIGMDLFMVGRVPLNY